ncbi:hypothetical protein [Vampirovibrio chlorellavorus]|uniref:hypothetical protein n=1 Tax=Vampirovibrio chlorellavorus TaxID=758823 RepID=UPI0026EC0A19|nr:hypothetical protein [Vampirovibrio chlorellavorus]
MVHKNDPQPDADVQQALQAASQQGTASLESASQPLPEQGLSDTLTHGKSCPLLGLRYALAKCAYSAEQSPWQTLAIMFLSIVCGWVCVYFGATVFGAWILYAIFAEES